MARDKGKRRRVDEWDGNERRGAPRVLVASDDPKTAELVSRVFDRRGFRARGVSSVDRALSVATDDLPRAVVIDLGQKGLGTSMRLLDAIRQHPEPGLRNARVVVCAASKSNRGFAFDSGADGFVERPYHVDDVVSAVVETLQVPPDQRAEYRRDQKKLG